MVKRKKSAGRKIDSATTKKKKGDRVLSDKELQNIVDHDFTTLSSDDDEEENALEDEYTTGKLIIFQLISKIQDFEIVMLIIL